MTHRNRLLAGALALALLAGACGGDDDDTATPSGGDTDETPAAVDPGRCPVDELEQVDQPVTITMWHTMTSVNAEELEAMLETPPEWRNAVAVVPPLHIDTREPDDPPAEGYGYD